MDLNGFILFDPTSGLPQEIPAGAGNYIVVLREGCMLPDMGLPMKMARFNGLDIIYTGVAGPSSGLRRRITWAHLGNNAGRSTLRRTLGILMGFKQIPRDAKNPSNGHVRFCAEEEARLTAWMKENLLFYLNPNEACEALEDELIAIFNPPLNLSKNSNPVNSELRALISLRRSDGRIRKPLSSQMEEYGY